jgi:hypothetical protein
LIIGLAQHSDLPIIGSAGGYHGEEVQEEGQEDVMTLLHLVCSSWSDHQAQQKQRP